MGCIVHRLAKYVVGPQGFGQEKVAGPAKNSKDMSIADVIYIFQPTKFSKLIPTLNKLHIYTATCVYKYSLNLLTCALTGYLAPSANFGSTRPIFCVPSGHNLPQIEN